MIKELIKELAERPCLEKLHASDWFKYSALYHNQDISNRSLMIKAIAAHSGVAPAKISHALQELDSETTQDEMKEHIVSVLEREQDSASFKIKRMQTRTFFNHVDVEPLFVSRTEWLTIIGLFEQREKIKLTPKFFFSVLSELRRMSYYDLITASSKEQHSRSGKYRADSSHKSTVFKAFQSFLDDDGNNPLIMEKQNKKSELQQQIAATGARSTELSPATPDKRYTAVVKTPGGRRARPLCVINGHTLFKPKTPVSKAPLEGRVAIRSIDLKQISLQLPRLPTQKAHPIKYTATLAEMERRAGMPRRESQNAMMKAKASDVFRAYGIEIAPSDGTKHHWSHLIAHFLGEPETVLVQDAEQALVTLIPSTAASNYNTLEAIENPIKNKLLKKETDKIDIKVEPIYSEKCLIPDMLCYTLSWTGRNGKEHNEIYYINPQSYERITKSMHQSIKALRNWQDVEDDELSAFELSSSDCSQSDDEHSEGILADDFFESQFTF